MAYYVTTPIFYVNAAPHLGHAYTTIGADILARHMRQRGEEVFFLTGTDEHGEPVAQAAEREGVTPKELADRNAERFKALLPAHQRHQRLLHPHVGPAPQARGPGRDAAHPRQRLRLQGHLRGPVLPALRGLQDRATRSARTRRARSTRSRSSTRARRTGSSSSPPSRSGSSSSTPDQPEFVRPRSRYNEALAFITGGLNDISLSRSKLTWGVEVPWDPGHVFYVWFDALLNYYTALSFARRRRGPDATVLAGVPHHRQGHPEVPRGVLARDADGGGHRAPARDLHPRLPADEGRVGRRAQDVASRWATCSTRSRSWTASAPTRCATTASARSPSGRTAASPRSRSASATRPSWPTSSATSPAARRTWSAATATARRRPWTSTRSWRRTSTACVEEVSALLDQAEITQALERIWQRVRRLNRYVEETAPWQLAKDETKADELQHGAALAGRGPAGRHRAADAVHPGVDREAAGRARRAGHGARRRALRRAPRRAAGREARARCSRSRSDRQPHPPRSRARARGRARRAGRASAGVTRILTIGMDGDVVRGGAARRPRPTTRSSPRSAATRTRRPATRERSPTGCASSRSTRTCARSARPASTTSATTRPAPTRSARSRTRSRSRTSSASRWSSTPARPRTTRFDCWRRDAAGPRGHHALLLDAGPARGVPGPRLVDLVRRQRHLPEGARTSPRRPTKSRSTACWSRPTPRT